MIGREIMHKRYGLAKVTHIWRKLINPDTKVTKLYALTFELMTEKGKALFDKDRSINGCKDNPLPRCFDSNLNNIELLKNGMQ